MLSDHPVNNVIWVPMDEVCPNNYNPNKVAKVEMGLLYTSIKHDGYTQPIVTIRDEEKGKYVIVDGFHRYYVCKTFKDIYESTGGMLPIVVIDKDANQRMASTVRHNRARGEHSIEGMSNVVFTMLGNGATEEHICNELGMAPDEVLKLKHISGFSKLFEDVEYNRSWVTDRQVRIKKQYKEAEENG